MFKSSILLIAFLVGSISFLPLKIRSQSVNAPAESGKANADHSESVAYTPRQFIDEGRKKKNPTLPKINHRKHLKK